MILITVSILFFGCAPQIGVNLKKEFSPEIEVKTGKKYPELKVSQFAKSIRIGGETFPIKKTQKKSFVKLAGNNLDILKKEGGEVVGKENWEVSYDQKNKIVYIVPTTKEIRLELQKQNPKKLSEYIKFDSLDFSSVNVEYKSRDLPEGRLKFSVEKNKTNLIFKIPSWKSIDSQNYQINISRKFYETYQKDLSTIENDLIKLKLSQSEFTVDFRNKEKSVFMPEEVKIINATGREKDYLTTQLEGGIELYNMNFPVVLTGDKYKWQLFNQKGEEVDSLVFTEPGKYTVKYLEKERELPLAFYDISTDYIEPELFENWVLNKKDKLDHIFLYVTNGYENSSNWGLKDEEEVLNRIYRISPRTSSILESIERFSVLRDRKNILGKFMENPAQYGKKLKPRYYIFISNENVQRLSTAVDMFKNKLKEVEIPLDKLTVCVGKEVINSSFVKKMQAMDVEIEQF